MSTYNMIWAVSWEKRLFAYAKTKMQINFAQLISPFVFATRIVQSPYFLNPKFQASGHLLWLYSLVCVGPGRKPRRQVFSWWGSFYGEINNKVSTSIRLLSGQVQTAPIAVWSGSSLFAKTSTSIVGIILYINSVHESCQHFTGHSVRQNMKVCLTDKIFVWPKNKVRGFGKIIKGGGCVCVCVGGGYDKF